MIKIGNAPCSWGALEFDLEGESAGYIQVLNEIQETGYRGTELGDWGFMPTDPKTLKDELAARSLNLLGAFVPVLLKDPQAHAAGTEMAVRTARLLSETAGKEPFIVLADNNGTIAERTQNAGRVTPQMGLSEAEWEIAADGIHQVARAVFAETGLRTVIHHHCAGYIETPQEIARAMALTDPKIVGLCLDTGHIAFGGGDPLSILKTYADRAWHIHFKDCHPRLAEQSRAEGWDYFTSVSRGIFCELGQGAVDFPAIKAQLDAMQYTGWIVVEQDVLPGMGAPKASAQRNRDYLHSIGL
jgi:inosose dehydratase